MRAVFAVVFCVVFGLVGCGGGSSSGSSGGTVLKAPTANAGGPYTGTAGTAVNFSGAGSSDPQGQALTYAWSFGDNTTGTGVNLNHTYAAAGTYTVSLTVTDTSGLSGSAGANVTIGAVPPPTLTGAVMSGSQPVVGAHVYLLAANTTGYGQASVSLLSAAKTGASDSLGAYVTSGVNGGFSLTGDYNCASGQQLYVFATGGNAGGGANPAIGMMAVVGGCPSVPGTAVSAVVNEVSTVAAAYALAGFATDATHVSSSGTALAQVGVANAFANAADLETLNTGVALGTTPAGNGTAPQSEINTLANVLAGCVNSAQACTSLLATATSDGTSTGVKPSDTATAAVNIAHHPGANVAALYGLQSTVFSPVLAAQPNDFTVALIFAEGTAPGAGNLAQPGALAVDSSGNVWIANTGNNSVTELSSTGAPISGSSGFTGGGLNAPSGIAVDASGNVWITNATGNSVTELSGNGVAISPASGYTGGGLNGPVGIAIDGSGNPWIANLAANSGKSLTELSSSGAALSGNAGYTGGGLEGPESIAISGSGNVWVTNPCFFPIFCSWAGNVGEFSSAGVAISGSKGYSTNTTPWGIAIDGSGNVWVTDYGSSLLEFSSSGALISGTTGYGGLSLPQAIAIDGAGNPWILNSSVTHSISEFSSAGVAVSGEHGYAPNSLDNPVGIAVDGSGNIWSANRGHCLTNGCTGVTYGVASITELVGAGTPVVTPLAAGVKNNTLGTRP